VFAFFRDALGHAYLGHWKDRTDNSNVEKKELTNGLKRQGHSDKIIAKVLRERPMTSTPNTSKRCAMSRKRTSTASTSPPSTRAWRTSPSRGWQGKGRRRTARRGRHARRLAALGRRLALRTAEAPGEVAAAVVEFKGGEAKGAAVLGGGDGVSRKG